MCSKYSAAAVAMNRQELVNQLAQQRCIFRRIEFCA